MVLTQEFFCNISIGKVFVMIVCYINHSYCKNLMYCVILTINYFKIVSHSTRFIVQLINHIFQYTEEAMINSLPSLTCCMDNLKYLVLKSLWLIKKSILSMGSFSCCKPGLINLLGNTLKNFCSNSSFSFWFIIFLYW